MKIHFYPFNTITQKTVESYANIQGFYVDSYPDFLYRIFSELSEISVFSYPNNFAQNSDTDAIGFCNWQVSDLTHMTNVQEYPLKGFGVTGFLYFTENECQFQLTILDFQKKELFTGEKKQFPIEELFSVIVHEAIQTITRTCGMGDEFSNRLIIHESLLKTPSAFLLHLQILGMTSKQSVLPDLFTTYRILSAFRACFTVQPDFAVMKYIFADFMETIDDQEKDESLTIIDDIETLLQKPKHQHVRENIADSPDVELPTRSHYILGAVIGDIVGSVYEGYPVKDTNFPLFSERGDFTDDTVLTIAIAQAILTGTDYAETLATFARKYPNGYGANFYDWAHASVQKPYNSWGNGSAMRVSPVGLAFNNVEEVLYEAEQTALPTHNHPEGIKGAQAVALAVFLARTGATKEDIKQQISERFDYDLDRTLAEIRPTYYFKISCQESVPESIIAFLESNSFEEAIRNAVSLGGDADTMACIAGSIAQPFYGIVPEEISAEACLKLPQEFRVIQMAFYAKFSENR